MERQDMAIVNEELVKMIEEYCVRDVMERPASLFCAPDSSLESVVKRLILMEDLGNDVDVIVVQDDTGLVGIMMPIDIFNAMQPSYLRLNRGYVTYEFFWKGLFTQRCRRLATKQVGQFVKKPEGLSPADTLMRAANFMARKQVDIAPVFNDNRELVGLVRSKKLFRLMSFTA